MSNYKWLLDAGHGGILNGKYTTAPAKMHRFPDGFEVMEGVTNRAIARKLWKLLEAQGIDFGLVYDEQLDTSLEARVAIADRLYAKDKRVIYLSIHSNAGGGRGFEVFTSPGQNRSDMVAEVFCNSYHRHFPNRPLRSDKADGDADKEADFYVLRKTDCPAVLVENLFFDNREEAEYLVSEVGQQEIAQCMFDAIMEVEKLKPI